MAVMEMARTEYAPSEIVFPLSREVLPDIPSSEERQKLLDPWIVYVAEHELQHALVGKSSGLALKRISVIPQGDMGGYTSFAPTTRIRDFQTAAAGSMVHGPVGEPTGYGHDRQQIEALSSDHNALNLNEAYLKATQRLGRYPSKVREYAAEIIAFFGQKFHQDVSDALLETILERARLEVQEEQRINIPPPEPEPEAYNLEEIDEDPYYSTEFMVISQRLPDGTLVDQMIEVKVCKICGGYNEHLPGCQLSEGE